MPEPLPGNQPVSALRDCKRGGCTCSKKNLPDTTEQNHFALWQHIFEFTCVCLPPVFPPRCATPMPLDLGGLYLCLRQLLCQLCRVSKQNSITERDEQTAAADRETEEQHQRSAESTYMPSIIIYLLARLFCSLLSRREHLNLELRLCNLFCSHTLKICLTATEIVFCLYPFSAFVTPNFSLIFDQ